MLWLSPLSPFKKGFFVQFSGLMAVINLVLVICSEKVKWGDLLNSTVDKVDAKHDAADNVLINIFLRF